MGGRERDINSRVLSDGFISGRADVLLPRTFASGESIIAAEPDTGDANFRCPSDVRKSESGHAGDVVSIYQATFEESIRTASTMSLRAMHRAKRG